MAKRLNPLFTRWLPMLEHFSVRYFDKRASTKISHQDFRVKAHIQPFRLFDKNCLTRSDWVWLKNSSGVPISSI